MGAPPRKKGAKDSMESFQKSKAISALAKLAMEQIEPLYFLSEITQTILAELEPNGALIGLINSQAEFQLLSEYGYDGKASQFFEHYSIWQDSPFTQSIRSRSTVSIKITDEVRARFSIVNSIPALQYPDVTTIALPLIYRLGTIGSIGFTFKEYPRELLDDQSFWDGFGSICTFYLVNSRLVERYSRGIIPSTDLTPRQLKIVHCFKDGLTVDQIAEHLRFSHSTIRQEIMRIYKKLGVKDRKSAIEIAHERKII